MDELVAWFGAQVPAVQVSAAAAGFAGLSLLVSVLSMRTGRQALKLAKQQESQRQPRMLLDYSTASRASSPDGVTYSFEITVRNLSDAANAIARADLWISYTIDGLLTRVAIPASRSPGLSLEVPAKVDPRQTLGGRITFCHPRQLLAGRVVRDYELVITDTFDSQYGVTAVHIPEGRAVS